jgi:hypothetical protein
MTNSKISALTSATTPLAGTETLPVVQSSTTKQVSVANLTAGRAVAMLTANIGDASGQNSVFDAVVGGASATTGDNTGLVIVSNSTGKGWLGFNNANNASIPGQVTYNHNTNVMDFYSSGTYSFSNGNVTLSTGNLVQGTAAKGVNFTANTPLAGMTSQLLNWYEQGTWTPTQGAGLVVVGSFSSSGTYTRVGRLVFVRALLVGSTSIAVTAGGGVCGAFPYTVDIEPGQAVNDSANGATPLVVSGTIAYAVQSIAASSRIVLSATFIV